jgi:hypothetical protein
MKRLALIEVLVRRASVLREECAARMAAHWKELDAQWDSRCASTVAEFRFSPDAQTDRLCERVQMIARATGCRGGVL